MAISAQYISATSFSVVGDQTGVFMAGRRVKANCGVDGFKYATISGSAYTTLTTVDLTAAGDDLTSNLTLVEYGIIGVGDNQSMPIHEHDGTEGSGGDLDLDGYATDADLTAASGTLQTQITTNTEDIANLDLDYATDAQLTATSGVLQTNIDGNTTLIATTSGTLQDNIDNLTTAHSELTELDYASAAHTGFASSAALTTTSGDIITYVDAADLVLDTKIDTTSGTLQTQIDTQTALDTFIELTDTPSAYDEDKWVRSTASGIIFDELVEAQEGTTAIADDTNTVDVTFATALGLTTYPITVGIENQIDANPAHYGYTITNKLTTGFQLVLSTNTDSPNYILNWRAGAIVAGENDAQNNHALLTYGLDYASSGHTGFVSAVTLTDYATTEALTTASGILDTKIDTTSGTLQTDIDTRSLDGHTHLEVDITDLDKYTVVEVDGLLTTLSGNLDSDKADAVHTHLEAAITDLNKYTTTEVDNLLTGKSATGHQHTESDITDLQDYVTETEFTVYSGTIQNQIDGKSDGTHNHNAQYSALGHNHNSLYYTETEIDNTLTTLSGNLQTDIDTKSDSGHDHDSDYEVINAVSTHESTYNHTNYNTAYSHSQTSHAPSNADNTAANETSHAGLATEAYVDSASGTLQTAIDGKTDSGHSHTETDITDLDHNANALGGIDAPTVSAEQDGYYIAYDHGSASYVLASGIDAGGVGETNTGANVGGGTGIYATKAGIQLQFKSLVGAGNITLTNTATEVTVSGNDIFIVEHDNTYHSTNYTTEAFVNGKTWTESDITDLDKYTMAEVDAISGTLNTKISGKADSAHDHDADYEPLGSVSTLSGVLQADIDSKSDTSHNHTGIYATVVHDHDSAYYTQSEVDTISGALNTAKSNTDHLHAGVYSTVAHNHAGVYSPTGHGHNEVDIGDLDKYTQAEVDDLVAGASGIVDHALFDNLDYASAGHTGFSPDTHNHDATYSVLAHDHDSDYSILAHNHDAEYSNLSHLHAGVYSTVSHNHTGTYSEAAHNHDGSYLADLSDDLSPTLGGDLALDGNNIDHGTILTVNGTYSGEILTVSVTDGSTVYGNVLYQYTDFSYRRADADQASTASVYVLALSSGTGTKKVLVRGQVCNTAWSWTAGDVYLNTLTGQMTQTKPSGPGDQVVNCGWALSARTIFFMPNLLQIERI